MGDNIFELKGLSFKKEELELITLDDLDGHSLSPGHIIFLSSKFNKAVLLLRAGSFVDKAFVKKYKEKGQKSFYILKAYDDQEKEHYEALWRKLKVAHLVPEQLEAKNEILNEFISSFWFKKDKASFLAYLQSTFEMFSRLGDDTISLIQDTDTTIFDRALKVAGYSVIMALSLGYYDWKLLSDIYQAGFLLDVGLISQNYNYYLAQCNQIENEKPLQSMEFLKSAKAPTADIKAFLSHPTKGQKFVEGNCYGSFYNPEMITFISHHHEMSDGQGFPLRDNYWGMSEAECVLILADQLVSHEFFMFQKFKDGGKLKTDWDKKITDELVEQLPLRKVVERLLGVFEASLQREEREGEKIA